ncbi:ribosome-dependent mRNA decay endonuclease Rae1/YacP [Lentibacillus halophilus]|uniref:Ribosome-dependent mRNA decay endonuclease Rae1/YacP n=1 Tax=Lentibacillus halophilus TaxID=295065 RepID=A0ABP3IZ23_9BACI
MNILVVDGYNIIGAWEELKRLKIEDIGQARDQLIEWLADYQAFSGMRVIVVFDAYYVRGIESRQKEYQMEIIYTKENETADECIERLVKELKNVLNQVYVATSDYAEQRTIFGRGALRKPARELYTEMNTIDREITEKIEETKQNGRPVKIPLKKDVLDTFEKWRRGDM